MVICTWCINLTTPCSSDLAVTGDGPHVCFAHLNEWMNARRESRDVTIERFDVHRGLVEVET